MLRCNFFLWSCRDIFSAVSESCITYAFMGSDSTLHVSLVLGSRVLDVSRFTLCRILSAKC